jgi:hypothetical protein
LRLIHDVRLDEHFGKAMALAAIVIHESLSQIIIGLKNVQIPINLSGVKADQSYSFIMKIPILNKERT